MSAKMARPTLLAMALTLSLISVVAPASAAPTVRSADHPVPGWATVRFTWDGTEPTASWIHPGTPVEGSDFGGVILFNDSGERVGRIYMQGYKGGGTSDCTHVEAFGNVITHSCDPPPKPGGGASSGGGAVQLEPAEDPPGTYTAVFLAGSNGDGALWYWELRGAATILATTEGDEMLLRNARTYEGGVRIYASRLSGPNPVIARANVGSRLEFDIVNGGMGTVNVPGVILSGPAGARVCGEVVAECRFDQISGSDHLPPGHYVIDISTARAGPYYDAEGTIAIADVQLAS
ncbi:MAG: hypothetical protein ABR548_01730 [Actinomycetota bacterium]